MEQRIGRYQILDEIAAGGQGTVYRAFDPDSGQIIALKVLHPNLSGDQSYIERFRWVAALAAFSGLIRFGQQHQRKLIPLVSLD